MSEDDEIEAAQLRAEYRWQRAQRAKLMRHPDCLDPDHPGCSNCCEDEDEDEGEGA